MRNIFIALVLAAALITSAARAEQVTASWYEHGHTTANGESYDPDGLTVAHRTLPFGTLLKLSRNGTTITVRVNDRGPFIHGRSLDLSRGTATQLGCISIGVCRVDMEIIE